MMGGKVESADRSGGTLTLGPVLFNWPAAEWRDFYFRIADEAPVDIVYIGEVVCAKRLPFLAPHLPEVLDRLIRAGKKIVVSTPALVTTARDIGMVRDLAANPDFTVEANDLAALALLEGRAFVVGPYVNVYNEPTLAWLGRRGAERVCLPAELPRTAIQALAGVGVPLEIQVFGRLPLAISARCYHARVENLHKDGCQFVCQRDPDGLEVQTLDEIGFLAINGLQTLSFGCVDLAAHLADLVGTGVNFFRLSPQSQDMVEIVRLYRSVLDRRLSVEEFDFRLTPLMGGLQREDGFFRGLAGAVPVSFDG